VKTNQITPLRYDGAWYDSYRHAAGIDEVKKRLERDALFSLLSCREKTCGRLLDLGTATGRYPITFARQGWSCVGVDNSPEAIALAELEVAASGMHDHISLVCETGSDLATPDDPFDVAICMMGTFAHIPGRDRAATLAALRGVLRDDGMLVLSNWNPEWANATTLSIYDQRARHRLLSETPTVSELAALVAASGFHSVQITFCCPFTDEQLVQWLGAGRDGADRIQDYILTAELDLEGQMFLVSGVK